MTKIEWVKNSKGEQGKTWNPIAGCSRISAGCQNCYAEKMTKRLGAMGQSKYSGLLNDQGRFNGTVKFDEAALMIPLKTKKATTFFVNSMSDLFHENVEIEWIDKIFAVMALTPQHTYQILTKRADRMRDYCRANERSLSIHHAMYKIQAERDVAMFGDNRRPFPLPNVWLIVSVENQKAADERIPLVLDTPAAVRGVSCEPLLDEVDLSFIRIGYPVILNSLTGEKLAGDKPITENVNPVIGEKIDWVIVGGESGPGARPCAVEWIRSIVEQCRSAEVPVFVKQLGKYPRIRMKSQKTVANSLQYHKKDPKGGDITEFPEDLRIREVPNV